MRILKFLFLFILMQVSLLAQNSLEDELERVKNNPNIKLEYIGDSRISINHSNIKTTIFNLGENKTHNPSLDSIPHFSFNLWELDTALFNYKYNLSDEVPVGVGPIIAPLLGDINNNNRAEIYGYKKDYYTDYEEVYCYEQDQNNLFGYKYKYPENSVLPYNIYDIDRDGNLELHLILTHLDTSTYIVHDQTFYRKPADDSLATQFYFDYNIYRGGGSNIQLNDFTFGDFNNDDTTDAIFCSFTLDIHLVKFNESELTFDSVYTYSTFLDSIWGHEYVTGFIVGDFDMDSKTDIIFSSVYGNIYALESQGGDDYPTVWKGSSGIWNSYIKFQTNDIDGNGKPEFWIGGESFDQNVTRLVGFETDGDNSYQPVAQIEFPGLLTLGNLYGVGVNADNDSTEELFINVGNTIVIIKYTGKDGLHNFEIFYYHQHDVMVETAGMFRFYNESYPAIILNMAANIPYGRKEVTRIYKHYLTTDVKNEHVLLNDYKLFNNYPNPFNPATNIKFFIPDASEVKLKIYNSLGEEIVTLLSEYLERGEYTVSWNGTNRDATPVPSGVYFIRMEAENFRKTIKSILIK